MRLAGWVRTGPNSEVGGVVGMVTPIDAAAVRLADRRGVPTVQTGQRRDVRDHRAARERRACASDRLRTGAFMAVPRRDTRIERRRGTDGRTGPVDRWGSAGACERRCSAEPPCGQLDARPRLAGRIAGQPQFNEPAVPAGRMRETDDAGTAVGNRPHACRLGQLGPRRVAPYAVELVRPPDDGVVDCEDLPAIPVGGIVRVGRHQETELSVRVHADGGQPGLLAGGPDRPGLSLPAAGRCAVVGTRGLAARGGQGRLPAVRTADPPLRLPWSAPESTTDTCVVSFPATGHSNVSDPGPSPGSIRRCARRCAWLAFPKTERVVEEAR